MTNFLKHLWCMFMHGRWHEAVRWRGSSYVYECSRCGNTGAGVS